MFLNVKAHFLLFIVYIYLSNIDCSVSSNGLKNIDKFDLNGWKPIHTLRVSTIPHEPFVYQNENAGGKNGQRDNGIEYRLIKTIAEKEQLNLSIQFHDSFKTAHFNQLLYKWAFSFNSEQISFCISINFSNHFSEFEILVGGLFPNSTTLSIFAGSRPYFQDELTWCIQKSKTYPMIINAFLAVSPTCWFILIFGVAYGITVVIYIMVQFDLKDNQRNKRDWHYTLMLITIPAIIGFNQRFKPKSTSLRFFYGFILIMMLFIWQIVYFKAIRFIKVPMQRPQISTIDDIASRGYYLCGSHEVKAVIQFDERVSFRTFFTKEKIKK